MEVIHKQRLSEDSEVAVAFSGGIDSLLVAYAVLKSSPSDVKIFLVNVAFGKDEDAWNDAPDRFIYYILQYIYIIRKRALIAWEILKKWDIENHLNLILVNVTPENLDKHRKESICKVCCFLYEEQ